MNNYPLQHKASELIIKHLTGNITTGEMAELDNWINASQDHKRLFEELNKEEMIKEDVKTIPDLKDRIQKAIHSQIPEAALISTKAPLRRMFSFRQVAAAASVILILSATIYFYYNNKSKPTIEVAQIKEITAPKGSKAMITLANGQSVSLDSISNGTLATQGDIRVIKNENGEIVYDGASTSNVAIQYNTLYNPKGSRVVNLTLQDGSKVWLNAESSLKYPTAFIAGERRVEITGEAYFEVAHNSAMAFVVQKNDVSVKVLGTHFNVNSYDDEAELRITLLEGSVQVINPHSSILIKPGQQAQIVNTPSSNSGIKVIKVNTEEVMAWKNGFFQINGMNIQGVMRQLERWYNVSVRYEGKIKEREFAGQIDRNANLSEVLKILKESNVNFEINGNQITVKP